MTTSGGSNKLKDGENSERDWKDIIPENERIKVEIEEESERLKQLNMPLGIRRNRALETSKKEQEEKHRKKHSSKSKKGTSNSHSSADNTDESYEENDDDDDDDDTDRGKKKRSKKSSNNECEHTIKGLNAQEVRRFVRSYRKFPCPLERIENIAQDAQLEEKSQTFLGEFAKKMESLSKSCLQEFELHNNNNGQTKNNDDSNENDLSGIFL
jgi:chromodomain-helicase-DNA-binding protein 1